jgi:sulfite reductase (NADPH) hemoprotein beta-component
MLAHIARKYDKGYGHFSTRQNIQYNWPKLEEVPDILADLASVEMHGIQTSGNCIRNITTDHLAGVAADELEDPRPWCEITRQWSTFHPEFSWLPRKFKIAFSASAEERAAMQTHDIGVRLVKNAAGEVGFAVYVGGGLGRTPIISVRIREFLEKKHLLSYLEAIPRVYNRLGRRDNIHKARIKILVKALGAERFAQMVETEWARLKDTPSLTLEPADVERVAKHFTPHPYDDSASKDQTLQRQVDGDKAFATWVRHNVKNHKMPGYRAVFISLKAPGIPPGDCTHEQMDAIAALADRYSYGEVRTTHNQNLVLAEVKQADLHAIWTALNKLDLATPNIGTLADMICCPGLDFCSLANAGSIAISHAINERFDDLDYLYDLGPIEIKMSGCMNGCGHHSVGHIGILGVEKKGAEWYQLTLGGNASNDAALGDRIGPSIAKDDVADAITHIVEVYVANRREGEIFLDTYRRIGLEPFKARVYAGQAVEDEAA